MENNHSRITLVPSFTFFVSTYGTCAASDYVISEIFDGWVGWADSEAGSKHPSTVETRLPTFVVCNDICKEAIAVVALNAYQSA